MDPDDVVDADTDADSDSDVDLEELTPAELAVAYHSLDGPIRLFAKVGLALYRNDEADCPSVKEVTENLRTLQGGCTDPDGQVWEGDVLATGLGSIDMEFEYTDFALTFDGRTWEANGRQASWDGGTDGDLEGAMDSSQLVLTLDDRELGRTTFTYSEHTIDSPNAVFQYEFGNASEFNSWIRVDVEGIGTFRGRGETLHEGRCESGEYDAGWFSLEEHPAGDVLFDFDGTGSCDGCVPYELGDETGTVCPY